MTSNVNPMRRSLVLGGAMVFTALGTVLAMPQPLVTAQSQVPDLERMLPERFGAWTVDRTVLPLAVSPEVAQMLSTLYDRTVSRTYVDARGTRMMLSLAYGANQSRALQLHKPEVCYAAQGFRITDLQKSEWRFGAAAIPTMHLIGRQGARIEPVTYWMRIGDDIARGWLEQNVVRLRYGARGQIPDGLLFRISNISPDAAASYRAQREFVGELLGVMSAEARPVFVGARAQGLAV